MLSHDDWMLTMRLPPLRSPCLVSPDTPGGICSFCMPSKGRHVAFGVPLQAQFAANHGIPAICKSLETLRHSGLEEQELFNNPADTRKVNLLKAAWDRGQDPLKVCADHPAVAKAFVLWLQALPSSLLPESSWPSLLDVPKCSSISHQLQTLRFALEKVEHCELQILSILLDFLNSHCSKAHVAPQSLGRIFAPPLLHVPEVEDQQEPGSPLQQAAPCVISLMISHVHVLFAPNSHELVQPRPKGNPLPEEILHPAHPPSIPIPAKPVPTRPIQAALPEANSGGPPQPLEADGSAAAEQPKGASSLPGLQRRPLRIRCPRSKVSARAATSPPDPPKCPAAMPSSCSAEAGACGGAGAAGSPSTLDLGQPPALVSVVDAMVAECCQQALFCS